MAASVRPMRISVTAWFRATRLVEHAESTVKLGPGHKAKITLINLHHPCFAAYAQSSWLYIVLAYH
jgi:hypothetical protein